MYEDSPIDKFDSSVYNRQELVSTYDVVCVDNGKFFNSIEDGKTHIHVLLKKRYPFLKKTVLFI